MDLERSVRLSFFGSMELLDVIVEGEEKRELIPFTLIV